MTVVLLILAVALICLGHPPLAAVALLLAVLTCGKTDGGTPPSYPPAGPAGTPMRPAVAPAPPLPVDYGVDDAAWRAFLARPNVHGTPGKGLAEGVGGGMDPERVAAGVKGEVSLAHMLASMDLGSAEVFLSCRNPADPAGDTDVDCVLVDGRTVWLLDAKHYTPAGPDAYLVPTPADVSRHKPFDLRAYDRNTNLDVDVRGLWNVAPVRTYHASGNMAWAADATGKGLPACTVRPLVLLCRTGHGTYGVMDGTCFPGGVPVSTADAFGTSFTPSGMMPDPAAVRYFRDLLK